MAHIKVSITRKYYGKIPVDKTGKPIPKKLWPRRRSFSWEVRWFDSQNKRLSKSFKDRKEACEHARKLQDKVNIGKADRLPKITLEQFIREHASIMKGQIAHATLKEHTRALRFFAEFTGRKRPLNKITPREAEAFISFRLTEGLSVASVNKDIRTLKGIFNRAIDPRGYIAKGNNPFERIRQRKMASKSPKYVSTADFAKAISASGNLWWKTFLTAAYTTAGRRDEILNLTWQDIDFEKKTVTFRSKQAADIILPWEPKDHENRVIPIPEKMIQLFADLQAQSEDGNPYVFIGTARLKRILERVAKGRWQCDYELVNNLTRSISVICKRAEIEIFTPHDLRRSCITNWSKRLPIQVVQQLAGHSNMTTTRKYYLSVQDSDLEAARRIQDEVFGKLTNF